MRDRLLMGVCVGWMTTGSVGGSMRDLGWFHGWWWNAVAVAMGFLTMLGFGYWIDRHDAAVRDDFMDRLGKRIDADPEPPTDVRVVYEDGTEVPVECRYVGVEDSCAIWEVASGYDADRVQTLRWGLLPAVRQSGLTSSRAGCRSMGRSSAL